MLPRFSSKVHVFMPRTQVKGTMTLYIWRRFYHNVDAMRGIVANFQILKKNCTVKFFDSLTIYSDEITLGCNLKFGYAFPLCF